MAAPRVDSITTHRTAAQWLDRWAALGVVWLVLAIATVGLLLAGAPRLDSVLHTVCVADCAAPDWQPVPAALEALQAAGIALDTYALIVVSLHLLSASVWLAVAALLAARAADRRIALLGAYFLLTVGAQLSGPLLDQAADVHVVLHALVVGVRIMGDVALGAFVFVFPDGRFVPRWTRWLVLGWIITQVPTELAPGTWLDSNTWPAALFVPTIPGYFLVALAVQVWRFRTRSSAVERQQTKVVVYGFAIGLGAQNALLALVVFAWRDSVAVGSPAFLLIVTAMRLLLLLVPLSLAIASLRYRLWDIDVLINRTLVYGALTTCIVALYVVIVGYLGAVFRAGQTAALSLVAAALVAVLFQPLRLWLQQLVNRLLYGQRDEPYTVLARLGQRLEATLAPEAALAAIVQSVREALRVPYAAIALADPSDPQIAAAAGEPVAGLERWPLVYQQAHLGELLLAPRAAGESFSAADRRLIADLARQAGAVAQALRLTADLRHARERLVTAREEERRRLRRDLHDGLGPQLASQALTIDAARTLMQRDPAAADTLLVHLKEQAQVAVGDVRRLVDGLRPPALDDLGLIGALRAATTGYGHAGLEVAIAAPAALPALPAAVEVAAFRIVQEALTNVVRHAAAQHAWVRLALVTVTDRRRELVIEVLDDGRGLAPVAPSAGSGGGVGLGSMRERAEELGGRCQVDGGPQGGTRVRAWLPLLESA